MILSPEEWSIVKLSLSVALLATLLCLPIGVGLAWLMARKDFWGKSILNSLIHLPLVLPPVVTGYLLLLTFGKNGAIGKFLYDTFNFTFAFRWTGAALAAALMALPLMVRAVRLSIEAIDQNLFDVAATMGVSRLQLLWQVIIPLAAPGIAVGTILTFIKALGEFGATITFVSSIPGETQTLSLAIHSLLQTPDGDSAAWRLILISLALASGALLLSEKIEKLLLNRIKPPYS
jgi:molybdate transport system permease protein